MQITLFLLKNNKINIVQFHIIMIKVYIDTPRKTPKLTK